MDAAGYIRVSISEQVEEGFSLESQARMIQQFIQDRGWVLTEIYTDAGISGTRTDRPELVRLLHNAERGRFDVVVVYAIDRFFRNLQGLLKALNHLHRHDVAFISISENLDFTSPWGKLALAVLGTLAEIYIDKLSADTKRGKQQRARNGLWNGSPPLGYCRGNCSTCDVPNGPGYCPYAGGPDRSRGRSLVLHPIESVAVTLAFEWYATGKFSDGRIAEKLSAHIHALPDGTSVPLRSKGRPGRSDPGPFSKDTIRDVLQNPFYTGVVPYYGRRKRTRTPVALYPGHHPALINQQLFDRCQEVRRLNASRPRKRGQTTSHVYPLSGILHCGGCGSKMRAQRGSSGNERYYVCSARLQRSRPCNEPAVKAVEIEAQVADYLSHLPFPQDWEAWVYEQLQPQWNENEARRKEQALKERLERAVELYLAGDITKARYEEDKRHCERELANLRPGEICDTISLIQTLVEFKERWARASDLEKKKLLRHALAAASVRGQSLVALQPKALLYPLLQNLTSEGGFYNGSDGGQTRCVYISMSSTGQPTGWFFRICPRCKAIAAP